MNPAIVIVTFNRPISLKRLLSFIESAVYEIPDIPLIISIDFQDSQEHKEIVDLAETFIWKYGHKKIIRHPSNLGLKMHVIACGDLSEDYRAVIILEDDIIVSPFFYDYSLKALAAYEDDPNIAGISLYANEWSQISDSLFTPAENGADTYFIQSAQSWGQIWSKSMWGDFKKWYVNNNDIVSKKLIPDNVKNWSAKSWLKYHIIYCVEKEKYFVYPYVSLSSNFADVGEHLTGNKYFQVALLTKKKDHYSFPPFEDTAYRYDAFYEREGLEGHLGNSKSEVCIDLYARKLNRDGKRFWLTTAIRNFKVVKSYGLELIPHELNVIYNIPGNDIFYYDTGIPAKNKTKKIRLETKKTLYNIREVPSKNLLLVLHNRIKKRIGKLLNKKNPSV